MLRNKSIVQLVKGKRNQLQVTINSNSEPLRLTAPSADEADQWLDSLVSTVRDLGLQDVFEVEYNDIQFDKTPAGELVSIGKGGSSNVVRARYGGRNVAVKVYKNLKGTSSDALRNEVMLLNAVKHPNILPIIGITKPPNVAVIMPVMEQGSLFDALHGSGQSKLDLAKYTWQLFFKVADDVARAVEYLHSFRMNGVKQPIIHSDLKSANLLVRQLDARCSLPSVFLIDFGISIQSDLESSRRQGTVCYMAPELLKSGGKITPKVDVFAYGVLLAELITLKIPFFKVPPKQIEASVLKGDRVPLPENIPDSLRKLINACWAPSPSDRPSMSEVRQGLSEVAAELIVSNIYHDTIAEDGRRRRSGTATTMLGKQVRLYDRRRETTKILRILQTFNKSTTGAEVIFVSGHSGYGKSVLLNRIAEFATVKGWVSQGKFNKDDKTPYGAIQKSMRALMSFALGWWGPDEKLEIRNRISFAFDETGIAAICSFIPEFMTVLERSEEWVEKVMKNVSADKFLSTMVKMFRLMTGGDEEPLVMCLDDMQWADTASLNFLAKLMAPADEKGEKSVALPPANIIVIGTYRDNEVDEKHPLIKLFRSKLDPSHVNELSLGALNLKDVSEMVEESFPTFDRKKVDTLASVVMDRSYGVPFFIHQFIQNMSSRGGAGAETSLDVLTDVSESDIVSSNLGDLTQDQQAVLLVGSFIAGSFSSKILSRVFRHISISISGRSGVVKLSQHEKSDSSVPLAKREAIQTIVDDLAKRGILQIKGKSTVSFVHEQVREAVSQRIKEEKQRQSLHLEIARSLLYLVKSTGSPTSSVSRLKLSDKASGSDKRPESPSTTSSTSSSDDSIVGSKKRSRSSEVDIFEVARHFTLAIDLLKVDSEACEVIALFTDAANQAVSLADFDTALEFCAVAMRLLTQIGVIKPGDLTSFNFKVCSSLTAVAVRKLAWDLAHAQGYAAYAAAKPEPLRVAVSLQEAMAESKLEKAQLGLSQISACFIDWKWEGIMGAWMQSVAILGLLPPQPVQVEQLFTSTAIVEELWKEISALLKGDPTALLRRPTSTEVPAPELLLGIRMFDLSSGAVGIMGIPGIVGYFTLSWIRALLLNPSLPLTAPALNTFANWLANHKSDYDSSQVIWKEAFKLLKADKTAPMRSWTWSRIIESYMPRVKSWPKVGKVLDQGLVLAEEENLSLALMFMQNLKPALSYMTETLDVAIAKWSSRIDALTVDPRNQLISMLWLNTIRRQRGDTNIPELPDFTKTLGADNNIVIKYAFTAISSMAQGILQQYEELTKIVMDLDNYPVRAKAGEFETIMLDVNASQALLFMLRTEQDEAVRAKYQKLLKKHKDIVIGWDRGSNNLTPLIKLLNADEEYSRVAYNLILEQQEMDEPTALQLIVRYSEALRENDLTGFSGLYNWAAGVACERCAEIASLLSFDTMTNFYALEAVKRYESWGSKALVSRVRSLYLLRSSSSVSALGAPVTGSSASPSATAMGVTLTRGVSSLTAMVSTGTSSEEGALMPHLAMARTFARGLHRFWVHQRQLSAANGQHVELTPEMRGFMSNLNHFLAYVQTNTHVIDETYGLLDSEHSSDSPTSTEGFLFASASSGHGDSVHDSEGHEESSSGHTEPSLSHRASALGLHSHQQQVVRLAELVESVADTASNFIPAGMPAISCFIPPTGLPSFISNSGPLHQLLAHAAVSFLTYFFNGPVHILVFAERQSASNYILRFQLTDYAPESLERPAFEIPHDSQQSVNISHGALAANIKFAEQMIESLEAELVYQAVDNRKAALIISVPVVSAPVIALHVSSTNAFQLGIIKRYLDSWGHNHFVIPSATEVTAKANQLRAIIIDADGATSSFIGNLKAQVGSGGLRIIIVGSRLPRGVKSGDGVEFSLVQPSMMRSELQRLLADLK